MAFFIFSSTNGKGQPGSATAEYILLGSFVVVGAIVALTALRISLSNIFHNIPTVVPKAIAQQPAQVAQSASNALHNPHSVTVSALGTNLNTISSSGIQTDAQQAVIEAVGANGGIDQVNANSRALFALAAKLQATDPQFSNVIVQLGKKGQFMAQTMNSGDQNSIVNSEGDFANFYLHTVIKSESYGQLTDGDQALIHSLQNQSAALAVRAAENAGAPGDAITQVNDNSIQTIKCGQDLKCH